MRGALENLDKTKFDVCVIGAGVNGAITDCLVTIDEAGNKQACLIAVREGMTVETQRGKRNVDA